MPWEMLFNLGLALALLIAGYFFGRRAESRHFEDIIRREKKLLCLLTVSAKEPVGELEVHQCSLVKGSVVISIDYFKRMLATLRAFFGGEVQAYETLLDRARREAVLRMKESCPDAQQIINLRIETSSIYRSSQSIGSVEVFAYGTALFNDQPPPRVGVKPRAEASAHVSRPGPTG